MKRMAKKFSVLILIAAIVASVSASDEYMGLNIYYGDIPEGDRVFYVAPDGDDANPGTIDEPWATLEHGTDQSLPGDVFVLRGGVYYLEETLRIPRHGTADNPAYIVAYPGELPVFDFSAQEKISGNIGVRLNGWYWRVIGITIRYAGHNGIRMDGSYNILEQLTAYGNHDTGIHMAGNASNNLIKNCDSFHNFNTTGRVGNNADGFGAKFDILPGNRFYGCRSWENSDDGYDFWRAANTIIVENSWAFNNGDASVFGDPPNFEGAGNGFKLGGDFIPGDHIVKRNLAFDNKDKGFDHNNNRGALTLLHNTSFNNGRNYVFPADPTNGQSVFVNNVSASSPVIAQTPLNAVVAGNSWQSGITVTPEMFLSVDTELARGARQHDGSLPEIDLLRPVPESFLVDGALVIGELFYGSAPDMGAYEYVSGDIVEPWIHRGSGEIITDLLLYDLDNALNWTIADEFGPDSEPYGDRDLTVSTVPEMLLVDEWIRTSMDSRIKNYLFQPAEFILQADITVFIAHSDLVTQKPEWLSAYEMTELKITLAEAESPDLQMSIFKKVFGAGDTVSLGRNSRDGTEGAPMYFVITGVLEPVSVAEREELPASFSLHQNFPNPFNPTTTISYDIAHRTEVLIVIYDLNGREIDRPVQRIHDAGSYSFVWDARRFSSGVYFYRIEAGGFVEVRRLVLIR